MEVFRFGLTNDGADNSVVVCGMYVEKGFMNLDLLVCVHEGEHHYL